MKKIILWSCVGFLVFSGLCLGLTYGLIQKAGTPQTGLSGNPGAQTSPGQGSAGVIGPGIDLYGTYDENDLTIEELSLSGYDGEVKVPQISGLKDTQIQQKINGEMLARCQGALESMPKVDYGYSSTWANFANVVSLSFFAGYNTENSYDYRQLYFNYDLTTGEELQLSDLFCEGTDILSLYRDAFYQEVALRTGYDPENWSAPRQPDEELFYTVVRNYSRAENPVFAFTPSRISFFGDEDINASVNMIDIADKVAIYHRFLTEESIFLRNDIGAERLFTCTVGQHSSFELLDYGYGADNFWYDITMWNTWVPEEFPEEDAALLDAFVAEQKALAYDAVEEYRQLALQNPDKFYIFFTRPAVNPITYSHYEEDHWVYTCAHAVEVTDSRTLYEMPLELFEEKYLDLLIKAYRYDYFVMAGGARLDDQGDDGAVITDETIAGLYNFRTGEEYTDIMQVFNVKKHFLQSLLQARVVDQLMNRYDYQYTRRQAEAAAQKMEYRLSGQSIIITIDGLPGFEAWENLHSFDPAYLTIYD